MHIYTLTKKSKNFPNLNSLLVAIRKHKNGDKLQIINLENDEKFEILGVKSVELIDTGLLIETETEDLEFIDVKGLIPTTKTRAIFAISEEKEFKHIHYGDGYDKTKFIFNRCITKDEFLEYLDSHGYKLRNKGAWYEDYSVVSGSHNAWEYKWVRVYTD